MLFKKQEDGTLLPLQKVTLGDFPPEQQEKIATLIDELKFQDPNIISVMIYKDGDSIFLKGITLH